MRFGSRLCRKHAAASRSLRRPDLVTSRGSEARSETLTASLARAEDVLTLLEWKRQMFALYQEVRASDPRAGWNRWRDVRDELFRSHPQSPLPGDVREGFVRLDYFPYDH